MSSQNEMYLTPAGVEKLRAELKELTEVKRVKLALRLREAIQMGDLSENADYIAAKEEQAFLEGRVLEVEEILRRAIIIQDEPERLRPRCRLHPGRQRVRGRPAVQ